MSRVEHIGDATLNLSPCPFCGAEAQENDELARGDFAVECVECGCGTRLHDDPRDAIAAWNRRAASDQKASAGEISGNHQSDSAAHAGSSPLGDVKGGLGAGQALSATGERDVDPAGGGSLHGERGLGHAADEGRPVHGVDAAPDAVALQAEAEPVAWWYEIASLYLPKYGGYQGWSERITRERPNVPPESIRNLTPLYSCPAKAEEISAKPAN